MPVTEAPRTTETRPSLDLDFKDTPKKPKRRVAARATALAVLLLAGAGGGYWFWGGPGQGTAAALQTVQVIRGDIVDSVSALGNLQPRDYVDLGAQVSGQLKTIHADVGAEVKAGDLLAEIDPVVLNTKVEAGRASLAALKAQLQDKEAQRDLANQTLERQRKLVETKAISEMTFESAEAAARSAEAQVAMLKAQILQTTATLQGDEATLGYTKIVSPMAGTVVSVSAREGQTLNANQQAPIVMRVADLSIMTVWTQVSEADVPKLKLGMKATFTTLGSGQQSWEGTLRQILPTPEITNNVVLYTALFDVENPKRELMTQMTAQVFFAVAEAKNVLTIPAGALRESRPGSGRYTVMVKNGSSTERRPVEVGVKTRVLAEIKSGLKEGDAVVVGSPSPRCRRAWRRRSASFRRDDAAVKHVKLPSGSIATGEPLIELSGIVKTYGGEAPVEVLHGISLSIYPGEFVAIMGTSGSGKSTLMNILGCLDKPTRGTYRFAGRDVSELDRDELARLRRDEFGFVFQSYNLIANATALENVEVPAIYAGARPRGAGKPRRAASQRARPRRPHGPPAEPAIGRPAAARLDRPRADERRPDHSRRRADGRARFEERR